MQYSNLENVSNRLKTDYVIGGKRSREARTYAAIYNIGVAFHLTRAEAIVASSRYW
jgi:hypothetical protein